MARMSRCGFPHASSAPTDWSGRAAPTHIRFTAIAFAGAFVG